MKLNEITLGSIPSLFQKALEDEDINGLILAGDALISISDYLESSKRMDVFAIQAQAYYVKLKEALEKEIISDYKTLMVGLNALINNLPSTLKPIQQGGWIKHTTGSNPFGYDAFVSIEYRLHNGEEDYSNSDDINWNMNLGEDTIEYYRECY